ncbi:MAG: hypothetical protein WAN69_07860 [Candidatus Korobacteraceae bacterium]|jgi:hypothetical protein
MDFFERIFHVSLDGGDGLAEFVVMFGFIVVAVSAIVRKLARRNTISQQVRRWSSA